MPEENEQKAVQNNSSVSAVITDTHIKDGVSPLEIESITVVINFGSGGKSYLGGQIILTSDNDEIDFTTSTDEIKNKAIDMAKQMVANAMA